MAIKTDVSIKSGKVQCSITANGTNLEQVSQYKYLWSWITEDGTWKMWAGH